MERPILSLDMRTLRECSRKLKDKLQGEKIDVIVPILKGGIVLASMLGRDLGVTDFACLHITTTASDTRNANFLEPKLLGITNEGIIKGANVLLVDDIYDTGRSIEFAKKILAKYQPKSVRACVAVNVKKDSRVLCALDYTKENYWIVFPWED